jgi:hypothetical protein
MRKVRQPKTQLRQTLAKHEELHELRTLIEQWRREWSERTPPEDQFPVTTDDKERDRG